MIKNILILMCLLVFINTCSAGSTNTLTYDFNGDGNPTYPNEGYIFLTVSSWGTLAEAPFVIRTSAAYNNLGNNVNYYMDSTQTASVSVEQVANYYWRMDAQAKYNTIVLPIAYARVWWTTDDPPVYMNGWDRPSDSIHTYMEFLDTAATYTFTGQCCPMAGGGIASGSVTTKMSILITTNATYSISGNMSCLDHVELYKGSQHIATNFSDCELDDYEFKNLLSNTDYTLNFSDGHIYNFSLTSNEVYDYDTCQYMYINLQDYCGNTMTNTSVDIYKSDGGEMSSYEFVGTYLRENPIEILVNTDIEEGKMLDIYFDTNMGTYHTIDYCGGKTLNILHPTKYWSMSFGAFDIDTKAPIEGMRVTMNQSCVIDPLHPLKQYLFTGANGYGTFIGLSAQPMHVSMGHPDYLGEVGYTRFSIDPFGDAFHTHSSIDTYFNKSTGENSTGNITQGCNIWFEDATGKRDNHINDTDTYVDLYYNNSNCTATLKFQRLYGTYWMTKRSFNIPALTAGYKRIYNVNFSDADANYRGFLYASECECNITRSLYVTNQTIEEEQHYENLTAHCKFKHQMGGGQVDYRAPVEVLAYAYSNTSHTLLNINLTLYELTTQIASKQCDWADFAGASPKWFYVWSPNVEYDTGKNYTVVMTGYNGLNLDADGVWTSNIRNNKLTVNVRDNHDTPLAYSTVFVQGWGSQALDSQTSFIVTGLQDEVYQYKATKSGYTSSGWASVNFSGEDKTVTCVLVEQETSSITGYKLKDDEIKAFFIPLMYILLVMILIGGLINASKR